MDEWIAVDWGTTNRRVYRIAGSRVRSSEQDARGIASVPPGGFAAEVESLVAAHRGLPMLMAGMIGSNRGWVDAGYVPTPAGLEALAAAVVRPRAGVAVVPGVSHVGDGRADVMRGEEVQLLGAVAAGLAPPDALICQPGTHCKWARMEQGAIASFITAMTGEMFALLKAHALIGGELTGPVATGDAFRAGVRESRRGDLLGALFGVRPRALLGMGGDAASYVSGLLIGADCAAHMQGGDVHLIADPALGALYAAAIHELGGTAHGVDSEAAFIAGIVRLKEHLA